ncbi:MAG: M61 family peptidase, partial [Acidobacteriota bacterium]|nr:M61 family peptidase [Acidobacteriota bacterium]
MRISLTLHHSRLPVLAALLSFLICNVVPAATWGGNGVPLQIKIDATDTVHKVFSVTEQIPLHGDASITLLYPRWEVASHAPTISVAEMAGLEFRVNGKAVAWHRDPLDVNEFHVALPQGAHVLEAHFDYLSPLKGGVMTRNIVQVQWEHLFLYPQGVNVDEIPVAAELRLPEGFQAASSLRVDHQEGADYHFKQCRLGYLADSPVFAGRYLKSWPLSSNGTKTVWLHAVADEARDLTVSAEELGKLRKLVEVTNGLFGDAPFEHYDFLVSLSDELPSDGGTEHQESSEIVLPADIFLKPDQYKTMASLFPHEYIHAWNGLHHRPAGMVVPNFNTPMQNSMLWVYEGLTELYGLRIARDSALITDEDYRDALAMDAAEQLTRPGRRWKSLADSDYDPIYLAGHHINWSDWERREDYYQEGPLLWLGVDAEIRKATSGKSGLNAFVRAFFTGSNAHSAVEPYSFADLVTALNTIAAEPWQYYLQTRLNAHDGTYLTDALKFAGYALVFNATESDMFAQQELEDGVLDLSYSIGARVRPNGVLQSVSWDGIAFKASLVPGMKIVAMNGEAFTIAALRRRLQ